MSRLAYLDGLKGLATLILLTSSVLSKSQSRVDEETAQNYASFFIRNPSWALCMFFILTGRILTLSFWRPSASGPKIDWVGHAGCFFRRIFRFVLPALFVSLLQWKLCEHGHFDIADVARSSSMGATAIAKPEWCARIRTSLDWWILFVNLFSWENVEALRSAAGMLWLTPWQIYASWFTYFVVAMMSVLPTNRFALYILLGLLSWISYPFHYVAMLGLVVADLSVNGLFRRLKQMKWWGTIALPVLCLGVGLLVTLYRPLALAIDELSTIQRSNRPELKMSDSISVFFVLIAIESSPIIQFVLSTPPLRYLGRLSFGITVLHQSFVYSLMPSMSLSYNNTPLDDAFFAKALFAVLGCSIAAAIAFFMFIEQPSIIMGGWLWKVMLSEESVLDEIKSVPRLIRSEIQKLLIRKPMDDETDSENSQDIGQDKDDKFGSLSVSETTLHNEITVVSAAVEPPTATTKEEPRKAVHPVPAKITSHRLDYLDGIRGIAMLFVFNSHIMYHTFYIPHPDVIPVDTFQYVIRHGQFALGLFFVLSGRVMLLSFFRKRLNPDPKKYFILSAGNYRRLFRLGMPAVITAFLQWQVCIQGHADVSREAEAYLKSGVLNIPYWCRIGTFSDFLGFVVDIFTSRDHQVILDKGSVLWTIYVQFWGSIFAYAIALIAVHIPRRRNLFYCVLIACGIYTHNFNWFFAVGLMICDWDASGALKATKKWKWWKVLALELFLVITAFTILSFWQVSQGLNNFFIEFTIKKGALQKFDPEKLFTMFPGWYIPAVLVILWIELSPVTQWFISSRIFRVFGKVSYGFYLLHMTLIYTVMPHIILWLKDTYSYWNVIIISYIMILVLNYIISYIFHVTVEEWAGTIAKTSWEFLFVNGKTGFSYLPIKTIRATKNFVLNLPFAIVGYFSAKVKGIRKPFQASEGHPIRPPHDHDVFEDIDSGELHSTYWETDLSQDKMAMRTAFILRLNSFLAPFHFVGILGVASVWFLLNPIGPWDGQKVLNFASLWRSIWLLSLPYVIITFIGFSIPRIARKKDEMDKRPVQRDLIRNFYIVIVTKGSNPDAVRRGYNTMLPLEKLHPSVKVVVLTDEPYAYPDLNNIVCPTDYKSEKGIAKHKARALDYFRKYVKLSQYDWILHMDEESTIDAESLRRCFDFIRYEKHHFGQGIILYNAYNYWSNWFFTVADAIRVGDDLARFNLQYTVFHRPVFGAHGSFLMTNGHLENLVTWDFGTLAEDFEFSHKAWELGFTCGAIHGIVREQSPSSVRDFLKQRRRWYLGIRDIKGLYHLPQIAIKLWSTGVFCLIATVINIPFSFLVDGSDTPAWIAACSSFCFGVFYWLYLWGLVFQDIDYGTAWYRMIYRFFLGIFLQPFCSLLEGAAVVWAMASENVTKFEVIKK
ncbi:glycosyl transferase family group 2-domain-containing protein [Paraphysoderma sedebokerense]|nr:glycosyl transferase family group 2-domain-containing protein [Paraphysoderma sedebokerense]